MQRLRAGEHHDIRWRQFVGPEVIVEEMHGEQEHRGEEGFFAMHQRADVEHPARQVLRRDMREGQHQTTPADDVDTPEHRPVIELLIVGPAIEFRPRSQAEEPLEHADAVGEVLPVRNQRIRTKPAESLAAQQFLHDIDEVDQEHDHKAGGGDAMDDGDHLRSAQQSGHRRCPYALRIQRGHAGQHQGHDKQQQQQVADSPAEGEAPEMLLLVEN